MLAKNVNDNACFLNQRGVCEFFASKLAPTKGGDRHQGLPVLRSSPSAHHRSICNSLLHEHNVLTSYLSC
ncbi:hypothetical protein EUX57_15805 [Pseudomonas orientalis]|uniref:Uncharacterized protein n=1 Tax=Pseudomonas orientalis TaxID=76758 RepID=A0A4Q7CWN8_9PSED|nr:hypothetical protein EUX57_15805 [Pseudomonas orientalis]